jgi:hypothetical protein
VARDDHDPPFHVLSVTGYIQQGMERNADIYVTYRVIIKLKGITIFGKKWKDDVDRMGHNIWAKDSSMILHDYIW